MLPRGEPESGVALPAAAHGPATGTAPDRGQSAFRTAAETNPVHRLLVVELRFHLRRMDVHVHASRVDLEEEEEERKRPLGQQMLVRRVDGMVDVPVDDVPAVQEEILVLRGSSLAERRLPDETRRPTGYSSAAPTRGSYPPNEPFAEDLDRTAARERGRLQVEDGLVVADELDGDVGPADRDPLDDVVDVAELGGGALEKLPAGGNIEEEILDR